MFLRFKYWILQQKINILSRNREEMVIELLVCLCCLFGYHSVLSGTVMKIHERD